MNSIIKKFNYSLVHFKTPNKGTSLDLIYFIQSVMEFTFHQWFKLNEDNLNILNILLSKLIIKKQAYSINNLSIIYMNL